MTSIILWLALLAQQGAQGVPKEDLRVKVTSIERVGNEHRVTIDVETAAREGDLLLFRFLPVSCRLEADGISLGFGTSEAGFDFNRAPVEKGRAKVSFLASRMLDHEVQIILPEGSASPVVRTFPLFDPRTAEERMEEELRSYRTHEKTIADFLGDLEPYAQRKERVPRTLEKRFRDLRDPVSIWADSTDITASASVLTGVMTQLYGAVPWDYDPGPSSAGPGAEPPKRDPGAFDLGPFRARLREGRTILFRECLLRILRSLRNSVDALTGAPAPADSRNARASVKVLCRMSSSLKSGELSDAHGAYPFSSDIDALIETVEKAVRDVPDAPRPEQVQELKALVDRLKAAERGIANPGEKP